jgi:hypothetical protein
MRTLPANKIKRMWWDFKDWLKPKQRWLYRKIPNHFCDKVELIKICIFESFIHFVEVEKGIEYIWHDEYEKDPYVSPEYKEHYKNLKSQFDEIYNYIKYERPILEQQLDAAYPENINGGVMSFPVYEDLEETKIKYHQMHSCETMYGKSYEEAYGEVNRLDALIKARDEWAMIEIVKLREFLWT